MVWRVEQGRSKTLVRAVGPNTVLVMASSLRTYSNNIISYVSERPPQRLPVTVFLVSVGNNFFEKRSKTLLYTCRTGPKRHGNECVRSRRLFCRTASDNWIRPNPIEKGLRHYGVQSESETLCAWRRFSVCYIDFGNRKRSAILNPGLTFLVYTHTHTAAAAVAANIWTPVIYISTGSKFPSFYGNCGTETNYNRVTSATVQRVPA